MIRHALRLAIPSLALAAAAALTGSAAATAFASSWAVSASPADTARPVVIIVHGRGQLPGDSAAARAEWTRTLRGAVAAVAGDSILRADDVWLAWYAGALDPLTPAVCDTPPDGSAAAGGLRALFAAVGVGLVATLDLLDDHAREEARALAGDFLFIGDPLRRCAGETQLARALARARREGRPVILVAHSLGSLVSYGWLRTAPPDELARTRIRRVITIGSVLGVPGVRATVYGDTATRIALPRDVGGWTNIVDPQDALAYPMAFPLGSDAAENLTTATTPAGEDPHYIGRYLGDPVTARAVVEAWCGVSAPPPSARSPASSRGCRASALRLGAK